MLTLFTDLKIGTPSKHMWKPVHTGIITTLMRRASFFVLLSRFGQDALENLFSTLRAKNAVPKALQFRSAIRAATLAQFFRPSRSGSYAIDNATSLVGIEKLHVKALNSKDTEAVEYPNDRLA